MVEQIIEGLFTIALVALVLTHAGGFTTLVTGLGTNYAGLVKGLQGR